MTARLRSHFADYAAYHQTPGNQACHKLGIPLIVLSSLALLAHGVLTVEGFRVTLAEVVLVGGVLFYLTLDTVLALLMALVGTAFLLVGRQLSWQVALGLFIFGWVLQFIGHYVYEKKAPAFYRNLTHLMVGPLWILAKLAGRA